MRDRVNLYDSEKVENYIQDSSLDNGSRNIVLKAYSDWLSFKGFNYTFKPYSTTSKLPFVPLEKYIDQLIAGFRNSVYAPFLQLIKECGFRSIEVSKLTPENFDLERQIVTLDDPAKNTLCGQYKISDKLTAMITPLIKVTESKEKIWKAKLRTILCDIRRRRKEIARDLGDPQLKKVTPTSIRHWKASITYYKTKDILYTQQVMRHRHIKSTMVYTHLVSFEEPDQYHSSIAKSIEEAQKLVESGFEYVTIFNNLMLFRKRK